MSGPAIHHIIAKEVVKSLKVKGDPSLHPFLNKLENEFSSAYYLGAQGPDFLFFNTKDVDPILKKFVDSYLDITDFLEDMKEEILNVIPQELKDAVDKLEEVYDNIQERSSTLTEISQLLTEVKNLINLLKNTVTTKLEQFITDNLEIFEWLKNPIQDGQDFKDWWWFDTLHYRRTGQYAQKLLEDSTPGTMEHAYALGYLTHYATDIVGHPFVNIVSGGPYRTHSKRHKLIENHHDVMAYKNFTGGNEFIQSKLGEKYIINNNEKKLPNRLNKFILSSIEAIYFKDGQPLYGKKMNTDDLDDAYRLWLLWFRKSTNALDLPKPEPYSFTDEMEEVWNTLVDNLEDLGSSIADGFSGDAGILGILKGIAMAVLAPFLAAAAIVDAILGAITTLGAAPIRAMISITYEELYSAYMNLHQAVVLNGFGFPFNSQLSHYSIEHLYNSGTIDVLNHNASNLYTSYPTKEFRPEGMECESHLVYPFNNNLNIEKDSCTGAPKVYYDSDFSRYMTGPINFDRKKYLYLKNFIEKTNSDDENSTNLNFVDLSETTRQSILGSAVDFSCILYKDFLNKETLADFNLDADRGIGFKSWRKVAKYGYVNDDTKSHTAVKNEVRNIQTDIIDPSNTIL